MRFSPRTMAALSCALFALPASAQDFDRDATANALDNCPFTANASQLDGGGVGTSAADGIGDVCQCGDVADDGPVDMLDAVLLARDILLLGPGLAAPQKCSVLSAGSCNSADLAAIRNDLAGGPLQITPVCAPAVDPLTPLSDEFDDPNSLGDWLLRNVVEGTPAQYSTLDIDTSTADELVIQPTTSLWLDAMVAPFVFKQVSGDFVVQAQVFSADPIDPNAPTDEGLNMVGLLVRDPNSGEGVEDSVLIAAGHDNPNFVGTRTHSTDGSISTVANLASSNAREVALCRIGNTYATFDRVVGTGTWLAGPVFNRPDLPELLQLGVATLASAPAFLYARVSFVRFGAALDPADCTANLGAF